MPCARLQGARLQAVSWPSFVFPCPTWSCNTGASHTLCLGASHLCTRQLLQWRRSSRHTGTCAILLLGGGKVKQVSLQQQPAPPPQVPISWLQRHSLHQHLDALRRRRRQLRCRRISCNPCHVFGLRLCCLLHQRVVRSVPLLHGVHTHRHRPLFSPSYKVG